MLHKVGRFNDIPSALMPEIPAAGTTTTYQFTEKQWDSATKKEYYRATDVLPAQSRVWIPKNNRWIDIGLIGAVDQNGAPVPATIRHIDVYPHKNAGYLTLTHGDAANDDLYQFLELAEYVGGTHANPLEIEDERGNKIPNPKIAHGTFKLIKKDFHADAAKEMQKMEVEMEAMSAAFALKGAELIGTAGILGIDTKMAEPMIKQQVATYAKSNPRTFLAITGEDKETKEAKMVIAAALNNGSVAIDTEGSALVNGDSKAIMLPLSDTSREGAIAAFAAYVKTDSKGGNLLKGVKAISDLKEKKK